MGKKAYLTIDVGSSSIRVSLFDNSLEFLLAKSKKILASPSIDVNLYFNEIRGLIRQLMEKTDYEICAVGASSLVGWVALSQDGTPLAPALTWMDQKKEEQEEFSRSFDPNEFYERNGRKLSPELGGLKLRHFKNADPALYSKISIFFTIKDFINYRLTGNACIDYTSACYTMLLNVREMDWDKRLIDALGVDGSKLPRLKASWEAAGSLTKEMAEELGLPEGIPVAVSGPDGSVGVLGAGGVKSGVAVSVMGTTDVTFAVSDRWAVDPENRVMTNPHVLPGLWLVGGSLGLSGGTLDWMSNALLEGRHSLKELDDMSSKVAPGAEGVLFIPSLTGERTPFWNANVRGTVTGLTPSHGPRHLFRALLEANGYTIRNVMEIIENAGIPVCRIISIGGGARSDLWMQIKSSITGKTVVVPRILEATTRGCVILAALAAGEQFSKEQLENPVDRIFEPRLPDKEQYDALYPEYLSLMKLACQFYDLVQENKVDS